MEVPAMSNLRIVDSTGAGDAFLGFFVGTLVLLSHRPSELASLREHFNNALNDTHFAAMIANAAGGLACESKFAFPSIPSLASLKRFLLNEKE